MTPFFRGVLVGFAGAMAGKFIREPSVAMALAVAVTIAVYWGALRGICAIERRVVRP